MQIFLPDFLFVGKETPLWVVSPCNLPTLLPLLVVSWCLNLLLAGHLWQSEVSGTKKEMADWIPWNRKKQRSSHS